MPLKPTPASRRTMGEDHTAAWLKNRQVAWDEHDAQLWHRHQQRTMMADEFHRQREDAAYSWQMQRQQEHEMNFPPDLPQPEQPQEPDEEQRQRILDEASHPAHLQQAKKPEQPLATLEIRAKPSSQSQSR